MKSKLTKFASLAVLGLALTFTISCSGGDDNGGGTSSDSGGDLSSSSVGSNEDGSSSSVTGGGGGSSSSSATTSGGGSSSSVNDGSGLTGTSGTITDSRDNKPYKWVKIDEQYWLAENLNYDVPDNDTDVCYNNDPANCAIYGRLYSWATAMDIEAKYNNEEWGGSDVKHQGICPTGWHIPNKAEWQILLTINGKELKSTSGWRNKNDGSNGNGTDDHGFSARPGGIYSHEYDTFDSIEDEGYWWTATALFVGSAGYTRISYNDNTRNSDNKKGYGYSVRCIKD